MSRRFNFLACKSRNYVYFDLSWNVFIQSQKSKHAAQHAVQQITKIESLQYMSVM